MWNGPTIIATAVGALGLVVAIASLSWQIRNAGLERRTNVRVKLARAALWSPGFPDNELLVLTAVNESSHPVRITKVGLDIDNKGRAGINEMWGWDAPVDATIPGLIDGRDTGITTTALRVQGRNVGFITDDVEVRAYVFASDGSRFESKWTTVGNLPGATHLSRLPVSESVRTLIEAANRQGDP